jgi:hypothetical protein
MLEDEANKNIFGLVNRTASRTLEKPIKFELEYL